MTELSSAKPVAGVQSLFGNRWQHWDKSSWVWLLAIAILILLVVNPLLRLVIVSFQQQGTGAFTLGSLSIASTVLGGNEQFVKLVAEHSRYYPIRRFRETVYSISGRLGLATPFGGKQTLPISERFFAGGSRDLRGFGFELAGPINLETGKPDGGNAVFIINNELRFPLVGILGGTVFSDTGNVFRRTKDFRPQNLTQTFGFGLRVKTPIGPVRIDFAFLVINKPPGAPTFRRQFSFGQTF